MILNKKNIKVILIEPTNQLAGTEKARPNGSLGPAYIVGALRKHGVEADYLDVTVGQKGRNLNETFYLKEKMENGKFRYGMRSEELAEIISNYDIVATSSIFTLQTRMHFEIAKIAKKVSKENGKEILVVSGGVNARALREHFLSNGFDIVALAGGESTIVQIVEQFISQKPDYSKVERIAFRKDGKTIITSAQFRKATKFLDHLPYPAIDAFPLDLYQRLGIAHSGFVKQTGTMFTGIQSSRGCQDKCTFCHISLEKEQRDLVGDIGFIKLFSNERMSSEVTKAMKLKVRRFYFEDDNLFFSKKRLFALAPHLKREGISYSLLNGGNIRFLVKKVGNKYEVDHDFINMLADFGLDELMLPFETANKEMMKKYATGKFDPEEMNPIGIIKALKKAGIQTRSNFLIGFRDESWESILRTKEFVKILFSEGLDQAGFNIPTPYPGTLDFEYEMQKPDVRKDFNENLLNYTDQMDCRSAPLFKTKVSGEKLKAAVKDFWLELNEASYTKESMDANLEV